jgi:hypothetical protein
MMNKHAEKSDEIKIPTFTGTLKLTKNVSSQEDTI